MLKSLLLLASFAILASCAPATSDDAGPGGSTATATGADGMAGVQPIPVTPNELAWTDLDPTGAPGVRIAPIWGDPGSGAFGAFLRLPAGFTSPPHTHTHPMKLVIVSGTYVQQAGEASPFRLGPGSYLMQPGGDYRHITSCDPAADCVFFFESNGAFDLLPADGQPTS